jgi:FkbM family methyltransferase
MFAIKKAIPKKLYLPLLWWKYYLLKFLDEEMFWVLKNIKKHRCAIDIGSNLGFYSYSLAKKFRKVESFEPLKELSIFLKQYNSKNINVHDCALGNETGSVEITIPCINGNTEPSYAGIGAEDRYGNFDKRMITIKKLDDLCYYDVDFIKIDVEGYEQEVLLGSYQTILKYKPLMLIELEERHRHNSVSDTARYLSENFGYKGFFLIDACLVSIQKFEAKEHQKIDLNGNVIKPYSNNFIFLAE